MLPTKAGIPSILIVCEEDEQQRRQVLSVILRPFFQLETTSLRSLVHSERLKRHEVDLILYDLTSSRQKGIEDLLAIKQAYPGAKIVLLTPHASADLFAESMLFGAEGSVVYPCDAQAFVTFLYELLEEA